MTTRVAATTLDTPVAEAAADMVEANVGSAVVMQGTFLAGILTERDVLKAAASGADLATSRVSDWMTPDPQTAGPDTSAEQAAQMMLLNGFRHLPVVDGRTVCGQDPPPAGALNPRWWCGLFHGGGWSRQPRLRRC
jgi:CBS domain-containing protein